MKPGITLKLFLAILAASVAAAAAMALATRYSFQSGFLGYLTQVETQRLDALQAALAEEYRQKGSWERVRGDYARLREIAISSAQVPPLLTLLDASQRLVAVVLARVFLQPLKRVAAATHRLAAGRYDTRVAVGSRDELGRLAEDFNRLAESLERNETLRRRFMADVSHELRTPLTVLSGELEALEDGVRPLSRESLASLRGEVNALAKLVNDLNQLALADVGALAYRKETVDIAPLVQQAIESHRERVAERGLALEASLDQGALVFADADRLQQMFRNLLENAARYTDRGGRVRVALRRADGQVAIEFDDTAPGVPSEALPHLFERFYRVEGSRSRADGGTGLGLSICRSIAAAHGGDIAASASPLGGLRVSVTLPVAQ